MTDLAMGYDGVLYVAVAGTLVLVDRRNRWPNFTLTDATFKFWRILALPAGGVLALDRTTPQLGRITGLPLQVEPSDTPDPGILRSCQADGDPTRVAARYPLPATETWIGFTAMSGGHVCAVAFVGDEFGSTNTVALLRLFTETTGLGDSVDAIRHRIPLRHRLDRRHSNSLSLRQSLNEALIYDLQNALPRS